MFWISKKLSYVAFASPQQDFCVRRPRYFQWDYLLLSPSKWQVWCCDKNKSKSGRNYTLYIWSLLNDNNKEIYTLVGNYNNKNLLFLDENHQCIQIEDFLVFHKFPVTNLITLITNLMNYLGKHSNDVDTYIINT